MNTGTLINFLGWASLTFMLLVAKRVFCDAIIDAINEHDEQIRLKAVDDFFKLIAKEIEVYNNESDDDSEDESEDENEDE